MAELVKNIASDCELEIKRSKSDKSQWKFKLTYKPTSENVVGFVTSISNEKPSKSNCVSSAYVSAHIARYWDLKRFRKCWTSKSTGELSFDEQELETRFESQQRVGQNAVRVFGEPFGQDTDDLISYYSDKESLK